MFVDIYISEQLDILKAIQAHGARYSCISWREMPSLLSPGRRPEISVMYGLKSSLYGALSLFWRAHLLLFLDFHWE